MGFGFSLFVIFMLLPLTGTLLLVWLLSRNILFGKMLRLIWLGVFGLMFLSGIARWLTAKTELDKEDYYGKYVINRAYFSGKQSAWQYDHFRFEITEQDSIFFYLTDRDKILRTYRGTIRTTDPGKHPSDRLIIEMEQPTHHILTGNPTTYRSAWSFYLVFKSPKFHNVFFKKGKW